MNVELRNRVVAWALSLSLLAMGLLTSGVSAAYPPAPTTGAPYLGACQSVESQAWWNKAGIVVPSRVGQHIHVATCVPTGVVDGVVTLKVTVTQHNGTGPIPWVRACRESSYCQYWSLNLGPCVDCSTTVYLPINVRAWPTGVGELRLTANVSVNGEGNRQFQSSGWPVPVRSLTCSTRCSVFWEARGWYTGHGYQNPRVTTKPAAVRSGGTVGVKLDHGADGLATKFAGVYVDPRMHDGDAGIVVLQRAGPFTGSVTLPTLPSGPHKLVLLASDGFDAGVLVIPFVVP